MTHTASVEKLIKTVVLSLVDHPEDVLVTRTVQDDNKVHFAIAVNPEDVGKIIGRQGRIIKAIRTVARAVASINGELIEVDVNG